MIIYPVKQQYLILAALLAADLLSFIGHYFSILNTLIFAIAALLFIWLCFYDYELALLAALLEIFVGSKGHLFAISINEFEISIRLAFFLIIFMVGVGRILQGGLSSITAAGKKLLPIIFFGLIIVFSVARGLYAGHGWSQVFFDGNAYFFIGLTLPLYLVINTSPNFLNRAGAFLILASLYVSAKTLLILYFFTHNFDFFTIDLYHWVRESGIGEITRTTTGAWRVFIQSQIFIMPAWWLVLLKRSDHYLSAWLGRTILPTTLFAATLLISFSRSFWLGLIISFLSVIILFSYQKQVRTACLIAVSLLLNFILGFFLIVVILKIPYPTALSSGSIDLSSRLAIVDEEAASSRWNLLPPLWQAVKQNIITGAGFGATVTYVSNDPRVRQDNPSGLYKTSAFEWGYLDIWLKIGLIGLVVYGFIIYKIFYKFLFNANALNDGNLLGWLIGLVSVLGVNIGSPYLNHPLGLTLVLLLYVHFIQLNRSPTIRIT